MLSIGLIFLVFSSCCRYRVQPLRGEFPCDCSMMMIVLLIPLPGHPSVAFELSLQLPEDVHTRSSCCFFLLSVLMPFSPAWHFSLCNTV